MIIRLHSCPCKRYTIFKPVQTGDRWHRQTEKKKKGPLFSFFFSLAVDFGKLRRTCQVIQNSKFFQVIFKQPRTEENVNKQRTKQ